MTAVADEPRRRYTSPRREQQASETRSAVLAAAADLFAEHGWAATGIRAVARQAGVSVETVYATFGSKAALLKAALELSVVGDSAPVPLAERSEFAAIGVGEVAHRAGAAASLIRQVNGRTAGLRRAVREGAPSEPELAELRAEIELRRAADVAQGVKVIAGDDVEESAVTGVWAVVSLEVYELLLDHAGWSAETYERWLADTIVRLLGPVERNQ